jgi:hypothetical protein
LTNPRNMKGCSSRKANTGKASRKLPKIRAPSPTSEPLRAHGAERHKAHAASRIMKATSEIERQVKLTCAHEKIRKQPRRFSIGERVESRKEPDGKRGCQEQPGKDEDDIRKNTPQIDKPRSGIGTAVHRVVGANRRGSLACEARGSESKYRPCDRQRS